MRLLIVTVLLLLSGKIEGSGMWTKCIGQRPSDAFVAPNGKMIPAWSSDLNFLGRADNNEVCKAYFAIYVLHKGERVHFNKEITKESGNFYILRNLQGGLSENGKTYEWIDYYAYHYGTKSCLPIRYDETLPHLICYLAQARLVGCKKTYNKDTLGVCNADTGESFASTCHKSIKYNAEYTSSNAKVLCVQNVVRREVIITSVHPIEADSVIKKPVLLLSDSTNNGGSLEQQMNFLQSWTKETSSTYSTEHGWRVQVSVTYRSGLLGDAIAKYEMSMEVEGHGKYTTSNGVKESEQMTYQRTFKIAPKSNLEVSVQIYKREMNVRYTATEKYYDDQDALLGESPIEGTWTGVFTFAAKAIITETPHASGAKKRHWKI